MPSKEKISEKSQPLVFYGDKGLAKLVGKGDKRYLKALRDFSCTWIVKGKRQNFPKFPAHRNPMNKTGEYFYIREEVEQWFALYGQLGDQLKTKTAD